MPVISIFSGTFCKEELVVRELISETCHKLISDPAIVSDASISSGISENKVGRAFSSKTSVFNKFTHEKERSIAHITLVLARMLLEDDLIIKGFSGHIIPKDVTHVLRVCLISDMSSRITNAMAERGLGKNEAVKLIRGHDEDRAAWVHYFYNKNDPWDPSLYDIVIPTDKMDIKNIVGLIKDNMSKGALKVTEQSRNAVNDFILSSEVDVALVREGHNVGVKAENGSVTLTINKNVLMLSRLEDDLKSIVNGIPGVKSVKTRIGPDFHKTDIYRRQDFEMPSKILLVDDEREFVQTLSERLLMREMGSVIAYDGESALELIKEDEPDVMILDLRMPGIDGIEVLRRVKETQPAIEVIILTGHGSEADRQTCMELGAFAYLQKPVDIEELSDTIKRANEAIQMKLKTR